MPGSYYNRHAERYEAERRAAGRAGIVPLEVRGADSGALEAEGERMIYVVAGDRLLVSRRSALGEHITHAVLADGGPVQAAGEFEVFADGRYRVVTALNNMSGHYLPHAESLDLAVKAFEARGWRVLPDGVRQYDWEAP